MIVLKGYVAAHGFLAFWTGQRVTVLPSEAAAKAIVCQVLRYSDHSAIGQAQRGRKYRAEISESCALGKGLTIHLTAPIGELDGTWHLRGFSEDLFAITYETPNRDVRHPAVSTTLRAEGPFAVRTVSWPAFVCPTDPEGDCVALHRRNPKVEAYYCANEKSLQCVQHGYDTEVFVMDPTTQVAKKFGRFQRQTRPHVVLTNREIRVTTDQCDQSAVFP